MWIGTVKEIYHHLMVPYTTEGQVFEASGLHKFSDADTECLGFGLVEDWSMPG